MAFSHVIKFCCRLNCDLLMRLHVFYLIGIFLTKLLPSLLSNFSSFSKRFAVCFGYYRNQLVCVLLKVKFAFYKINKLNITMLVCNVSSYYCDYRLKYFWKNANFWFICYFWFRLFFMIAWYIHVWEVYCELIKLFSYFILVFFEEPQERRQETRRKR